MKTRVSLSEVAKAAGVHPATVSHVLNGRDSARIAKATQERIRQVANEMGYAPNRAARALATGRSHLVALQTFDLRSTYSAEIASRLQTLLSEDGFDLMVTLVDRDLKDLSAYVDGVIALDYYPHADLSRIPCPYVALGVYYPADRDAVVIDFLPGAQRSVSHLLEQGRKRIVYLTDSDLLHASDPREEAYVLGMQSHGLEPEVIVHADRSRAAGVRAFDEHVAKHGWPDAVTCRNDELALAAMASARRAGLRVPEDLAVVGSDGIVEGTYTTPNLSTLVVPFDLVCRCAWELLNRRMADPDGRPERQTFSAEFQERGSSKIRSDIVNEEIHEI